MATATKPKSSPPSDVRSTPAAPRAKTGPLWALYRFLASVKLAVISISLLAGVLGYATFYESWHGTNAVQETIYRSWWFGALLGLLGVNIFCAASIRYPWKKRQTGFVVTHAGLLVVLLASFLMARICREGSVAFGEGERTAQLIKSDSPVLRVRPIDTKTGKVLNNREFVLDFQAGAFAWPAGRSELLTQKADPFDLRVKAFLPASVGKYRHEELPRGEVGVPMLRLGLAVAPPNALRPIDVFREDLQDSSKWFTAPGKLQRKVKSLGGIRVIFQYLDRDVESKLDDFLNPPKTPTDFARLHYKDAKGAPRVYEWTLGADQKGQAVTLPDSDLKVTFTDTFELPQNMLRELDPESGDAEIVGAKFEVRKGDGPPRTYYGWTVPLLPSFMETKTEGATAEAPDLTIGFVHDPHFEGMVRGQLEIVAIPGEKLFHRYTNKAGVQSIGPIEENRELTLGGGPNQPMALTFEVKDYFPSGKETFGFVALQMPKGKQSEGIPAALVEMTVDGQSREFWVRGQASTEPSFTVFWPDGTQRRFVEFDDKVYEVGYDVDRTDLPFSLKLVDFDVRFDRGTPQPKSYTSKVLLTDEDRGLKDDSRIITMNEPLEHGWWTCYQASYREIEDPMTGQKSGQFMSILQTRYDPVWPVMYGGCALVVLGTFLQFYMRAGVFTDGGKRERAAAAGGTPPDASPAAPEVESI